MNARAGRALVALVLAGCGGGGHAGSSSVPATPGGPTQAGTLGLTFSAQPVTSSSKRNPKFVSPNATVAQIFFNNVQLGGNVDVSATSSLCQTGSSGRACNLPVNLTPGANQTIGVVLFSGATPAAFLGSGDSSINVVLGTPFNVTVGVNPVAASFGSFNFSPSPSFQYNTASSITGTVVFTDPSGAPITGSGNVPNFFQAITLTSTDPHVTFSPSTLTTPGQTFTATYDGSAAVSSRVTVSVMSGTNVIASAPVIVPGLVVQRFNLGAIGTINPQQIAVGSDGNVWVAEFASNQIARVTPAGGITQFASGFAGGHPVGIASGGDGNLYYSDANSCQVGRMNTTGVAPSPPLVTTVGGGCALRQMAKDNLGNVWYLDSGNDDLGFITPGSWPGGITNCLQGNLSNSAFIIQNNGITVGADSAMYFTENNNHKIGRMASTAACLAATYTETPITGANPGDVFGIANGSDGNLWFNVLTPDFYAKITPGAGGVITEYPGLINSASFGNPVVITVGGDGNMWIPQGGGAVSFNPANPTVQNTQFFTDVGQTDNHSAIQGPEANPGFVWFSGLGSAPGGGFIPTQDEVAKFAPR